MQRLMRVAMLTQAFHPRVGGAERQLLAVAPLLQERGVDVHVLTRRYPGLAQEEEVRGIPVHRLGSAGAGVGSLAYTAQCQALLRRLAPSLLHAYELLSPTTTALLAKQHVRAPVVVKVLGGGEFQLLERRPLGRWRLRTAAKHVDAFHVVSDDIDMALASRGVPSARRVRVPNGVDVDHFRPATSEEHRRSRNALDLPAGAPVVVYVGRLSPEKGVSDLQRAWPLVVQRHPEATLLLAGEGPLGTALASSAPARCRQLGPVDDVRGLLHAADMLVLPSHSEGAPNVLLEAMAAGVPCVVTAVGGSAELAADGRLASCVPPAEPRLLAEAVVDALSDPAAGRRRAGLAREHVLRHRSLTSTADGLVALYVRLLQGARTGGPYFPVQQGPLPKNERPLLTSPDEAEGGPILCGTRAGTGGSVRWRARRGVR